MSYRIQVTIDDQLMETIKVQAAQMGLSVSSFSRLALKSMLEKGAYKPLLQQVAEGMRDENISR